MEGEGEEEIHIFLTQRNLNFILWNSFFFLSNKNFSN